jgi:hypothetical protein
MDVAASQRPTGPLAVDDGPFMTIPLDDATPSSPVVQTESWQDTESQTLWDRLKDSATSRTVPSWAVALVVLLAIVLMVLIGTMIWNPGWFFKMSPTVVQWAERSRKEYICKLVEEYLKANGSVPAHVTIDPSMILVDEKKDVVEIMVMIPNSNSFRVTLNTQLQVMS